MNYCTLNISQEKRRVNKMKNCLVVADPNKCIGCRTCEAACGIAHSGGDFFNTNVSKINFNPRLNVIKTAKVSAPVQCRQCEDAPCGKACPVNAISNENGYVSVNKDVCVGCKICMLACPFGAIELASQYRDGEVVDQKGLKMSEEGNPTVNGKGRVVANKCDLCQDRDGGPACIEVCPTKSLKLVTYDDNNNIVEKKR